MLQRNFFDLTSNDLKVLCRHLEQALDLGIAEESAEAIREFLFVFQGLFPIEELNQQSRSDLLTLLSKICRSYNYRRTYYRTLTIDEVLRYEHNVDFKSAKIAYQRWANDYLELRRITKKIRV